MIGEIKVALKQEMKTEGEQLVLEILQCRNITYKFKSPDHLPGISDYIIHINMQIHTWPAEMCKRNLFTKTPEASSSDLYVKLYVVNVATQKRIIKKKTRVCRHDREPSFNETFRFSLNPAGHSIQVRTRPSFLLLIRTVCPSQYTTADNKVRRSISFFRCFNRVFIIFMSV